MANSQLLLAPLSSPKRSARYVSAARAAGRVLTTLVVGVGVALALGAWWRSQGRSPISGFLLLALAESLIAMIFTNACLDSYSRANHEGAGFGSVGLSFVAALFAVKGVLFAAWNLVGGFLIVVVRKGRYRLLLTSIVIVTAVPTASLAVRLARDARIGGLPSGELSSVLAVATQRRDEHAVRLLARHKELGQLELATIARLDWPTLEEPQVRLADIWLGDTRPALVIVAGRSDVSPDVLRELSDSRQWQVLRVVAQAPACPTDVLGRLATSNRKEVRLAVARHTGTSVSTLMALSEDVDTDVAALAQESVAKREDAIHGVLSGDDVWARTLLAQNPFLAPMVLAVLAADAKALVREAIAANPHSPRETVLTLLDDEDLDVRRAAAEAMARRFAQEPPGG